MKGKRIAQLEAEVARLSEEVNVLRTSITMVSYLVESCDTIETLRHRLLDAQIAAELDVPVEVIFNNVILRRDDK
jgi:prefoldin subunit 5